MTRTELARRASYRDAVASYFKARPMREIDAKDLMHVGGSLAFRTRISECRTDLHMNIVNRQEHHADGTVTSWYMWIPDPGFPLGRQAHEFTQQPELF